MHSCNYGETCSEMHQHTESSERMCLGLLWPCDRDRVRSFFMIIWLVMKLSNTVLTVRSESAADLSTNLEMLFNLKTLTAKVQRKLFTVS